MELASGQAPWLEEYLDHFRALIGDRRTGRAFRGIVQGIWGAESLVCARIAAFSLWRQKGHLPRLVAAAGPALSC